MFNKNHTIVLLHVATDHIVQIQKVYEYLYDKIQYTKKLTPNINLT